MVGEEILVWEAARGVAPFWGEGVSKGMEAGSLTPSVWAPPSIGSGLVEGIGISIGTHCVVVGVVGAIALATTLTPSKKPSMGVPMTAKTSLAVG